MRRGEIAGLSWRDVDLDVGIVTVHHTVVPVQGRAERGTPKSSHGLRRIPLDQATAAALGSYRATQQQERLLWGPAYASGGDEVFT